MGVFAKDHLWLAKYDDLEGRWPNFELSVLARFLPQHKLGLVASLQYHKLSMEKV